MRIQAWHPFNVGPNFFIPIKMLDDGWVGLTFDDTLWWFSGTTMFFMEEELTKNEKETVIRYIFRSKHSDVMDESWAKEALGR